MKIKEIKLRSRNCLSIRVWFMPNKLVTLFAFILLQSQFFNSYGSVRWKKVEKICKNLENDSCFS